MYWDVLDNGWHIRCYKGGKDGNYGYVHVNDPWFGDPYAYGPIHINCDKESGDLSTNPTEFVDTLLHELGHLGGAMSHEDHENDADLYGALASEFSEEIHSP